ncbi:MAG: glycosyltransferase family 2 protein [Okeania sp. SIO3H1]|uniref:hormogonium polysaccharide biosynthesis glycosyltransferase HpsE n=1 Tax=Okeania sp. SIO1I7 TaxID=2607772 RepID=UPI0013C69D98|nr:glycosyltransferase family 2 protein [Okeania sp. SIO3H1]NET29674.1 glycosyltransferase family 2 protein [Okeania sp. SIO1I7]
MLDFTIAIPTYNGATRLPIVLEKLRSQINTENISWEVIVVDNNSSDNLTQVVNSFQHEWPDNIPLRYCFEAEQGLAFARQKAIEEANGNFIGFLDDDNLPEPDWVIEAVKFGQEHQTAGAYSGRIIGYFEAEPPEKFDTIQAFLAIREHGSETCLFEPEKLRLPPGAGLVVRKQAWSENVPTRLALVGRVGNSIVAGEDYEALLYLHKGGWKIWYNPTMCIHHKIPKHRLEKEYLIPLAKGIGLATFQLLMINAKSWQKPLIFLKTILGNIKRILLLLIKNRFQVKKNLIAAFKFEFLWGSLLSPFYYLKKMVTKKSGFQAPS